MIVTDILQSLIYLGKGADSDSIDPVSVMKILCPVNRKMQTDMMANVIGLRVA